LQVSCKDRRLDVVDEVSPGMGGILYERNDTAGDVISFTQFPLTF
jgi:hypothetical protein